MMKDKHYKVPKENYLPFIIDATSKATQWWIDKLDSTSPIKQKVDITFQRGLQLLNQPYLFTFINRNNEYLEIGFRTMGFED